MQRRSYSCRAGLVCVAALASVLCAAPAMAQPAVASMPAATSEDGGRVSATLSATKLGEDWYLRLGLGLTWTFSDLTIARQGDWFERDQTWPLRLRFHVPLAFRVADRAPTDNGGAFRTRDWDEPAEYLRILRSVEYGAPYGGVWIRSGELANIRIGHRTIVDNYQNVLDVNRFRWGVAGSLNTLRGGAELLLDDVTRPQLMAARGWVRPVAFTHPGSWWRRLAAGVTIAGDIDAPAQLTTLEDGRYVVDDRGAFDVERADVTGILGLDVELAVVQEERWTLTPYSDANFHLGRGTGWHLGTFAGVRVTPTIGLDARLEYRLLGAGYLPAYFGPLYEVERYAYRPLPGLPTRLPKLQWLRSGAEDRLRPGVAAELGLNVGNLFRLELALQDERGPDNTSVWIYASVPALQVVQFGAWYANTRFDGLDQMFDLDEALATLEARVMLTSWLFLTGQVNRRWLLDSDGAYAPVDDFAVGAGASFGF